MKKLCFVVFFAILSLGLFAQTADELDSLLASDRVSYGQAAKFILAAAEIVPEDADAAAAFGEAESREWVSQKSAADSPVSLREAAFLLMKAFDLKGGMMYRLIPGPRYAYREMVNKKVIQGRTDPGQTISGTQLIQILGRVLSQKEGEL